MQQRGDLPAIERIDQAIESITPLKKAGSEVKHGIHRFVLRGWPLTRKIADVLHGTWLGHPLHPVLTDATIGAWLFAAVFDVMGAATRRRSFEDAGDRLTELGIVTGTATAVTGLTDYSTIKQDAVEYGAAHGALNGTAFVLYTLSARARRTDRRGLGLALSAVGLGLMGLSAWLGGEMVFRQKVGVDHGQRGTQPEDWTPVLRADELREGEPRRVEVDGRAVLLYRRAGEIFAIGAVCAHAGGPLDEGAFEGTCVQCPWHDSVYDLRDGSIVHGPSTYNQPRFEARVINSFVHVRAYPSA